MKCPDSPLTTTPRSLWATSGSSLGWSELDADRSHCTLPRSSVRLLSTPVKVCSVAFCLTLHFVEVYFPRVVSLEQDALCEMYLSVAYQDLVSLFIAQLWLPIRFAGCNVSECAKVDAAICKSIRHSDSLSVRHLKRKRITSSRGLQKNFKPKITSLVQTPPWRTFSCMKHLMRIAALSAGPTWKGNIQCWYYILTSVIASNGDDSL